MDLAMKNGKNQNELLKTFCICDKKSSDEGEIMIQCENCEQWFHLPCVNLTTRLVADIETYMCAKCHAQDNTRQIVYKKRKNFHRHDFSDALAAKKPMQAGTQAFVQNLLNKKFPDALEEKIVMKVDNGEIITKEYLEKIGFNKPILIEDKSGLGFTMPSSDEINLTQIENIVGGDYLLDVIDVERQEVFPMSINELNSYFQTEPRSKVYNLISFEISKTKLTENITAPRVVHEISWVSNGIWPSEQQFSVFKDDIIKPEVQKYCLISASKSYTDFHVDFGGSSVWYHVLKGDKIFYLIEPNEENLKIYENWNCLKNHSEIFLGDKVKKCYKFELSAGNTIFLPTGWIHAVYTPTDSLVFGGNFLHSLNIPLQIKIYEMELRLKTPEKYRFPAFETLQWHAAKYYTQMLKELNSNRKCIPMYLFNGLKFLNNSLKKWIHAKDYYQNHDHEIPKKINCDKLVKIMSKELTKGEILLKSKGLYKTSKSLSSSPNSKMFVDGHADELDSTSGKTKQKEVINFKNMNLFEIKLDSSDQDATSNEQKPIKVESIDELIKNESSDTDDEVIKDLKNSYQDNEFVYPTLSSSKQNSTTQPQEEQKSSRKRKLKPFAMHILQPKQSSEELKKKNKSHLENMIKKNLTNEEFEDEDEGGLEDEDYLEEDEDADDNDEDFKLKCKNNLKISKKLKKNLLKQQKKEGDESTLSTSGLAPSAVASKNNLNKPNSAQTQSKPKKGFATTKQRLGKLLKLNRVVNI